MPPSVSAGTTRQVSTSAALVEGIYQGAVRVSRLLQHGDFGLGTFIDLDGEMVVLDGVCYRVSPTGSIAAVEGDLASPLLKRVVGRLDDPHDAARQGGVERHPVALADGPDEIAELESERLG